MMALWRFSAAEIQGSRIRYEWASLGLFGRSAIRPGEKRERARSVTRPLVRACEPWFRSPRSEPAALGLAQCNNLRMEFRRFLIRFPHAVPRMSVAVSSTAMEGRAQCVSDHLRNYSVASFQSTRCTAYHCGRRPVIVRRKHGISTAAMI